MDWRQATACIRDVAEGLAAAAEHGIVHRDIKPQNIMLTTKGVAKLADFGLARAGDSTAMTSEGALMGTPLYMSPEACRGDIVDVAGDMYSLGATWYHLIAGRPPFVANTPLAVLRAHCDEEPVSLLELIPDCPLPIAQMIHSCLIKDVGQRLNSAEKLLQKLSDAVAEGYSLPRTVPELAAIANNVQEEQPSTVPTALAATAPSSISDRSSSETSGTAETLPTAVPTAESARSSGVNSTEGAGLAESLPGTDFHNNNRPTLPSEKKKPPYVLIGAGALLAVAGLAAWQLIAGNDLPVQAQTGVVTNTHIQPQDEMVSGDLNTVPTAELTSETTTTSVLPVAVPVVTKQGTADAVSNARLDAGPRNALSETVHQESSSAAIIVAPLPPKNQQISDEPLLSEIVRIKQMHQMRSRLQ